MKKLVIGLFSLFAFDLAEAGTVSGAKINKIVVQGPNSKGGDRFCIYVDKSISGSPDCSSSNRFCVEAGSALGNSVSSTALFAYATNHAVYINGTGSCSVVSNSEDIHVLSFEK